MRKFTKEEFPHFYFYHSYYNFVDYMVVMKEKRELNLVEALDYVYERELKKYLYNLSFFSILELSNKAKMSINADIINQLVEYIIKNNSCLESKEVRMFMAEYNAFVNALMLDLDWVKPDRPLKEFTSTLL